VTAVNRGRTWLRGHPLVADAVIAAALFLLVALVPGVEEHDGSPVRVDAPLSAVVVSALTCAALAFRRRQPVAVLVLATAGSMVTTLLIGGETVLAVSAMIAVYTVAVRSDRRIALIAWISTSAALTVAHALTPATSAMDPDVLSYVAWTGVGAAVGDALRHRRAYVAAVEERADRAERTREEEARRRVAEERLHIARELHDVIAHRMTVVTVQAGVARHLLHTQPEAAEEALGHVCEASRAILDELGDILNVLREPGESAGPTAPAPSLAQLDPLIASFAAAGLTVDWSLTGHPRAVGSNVDLVAYRVLQEALTNAHKHGTGTAHVSIGYTPSSVALVVQNPVKGAETSRAARAAAADQDGYGIPPADIGHGLIGMRERAAAVGGVLHAGEGSDGQFRVEAILPVAATSVS